MCRLLHITLNVIVLGLSTVETGLPFGNGLFTRANRVQHTIPTAEPLTNSLAAAESRPLLSASQTLTQQYFIVRPRDMKSVQGEHVSLECRVGKRKGKVQWSKDGFLLGYQTKIPGFPRHIMVINDSMGIYNLFIHDVRMEDEGMYQCQVGPAKGVQPIRAEASLQVIFPPVRLDINGSDASKIAYQVPANSEVILTCTAKMSRPETVIRWFRKSVELVPEAARTLTVEESERRLTTISSITLWPSNSVVNDQYTCEALHPALRNKHMKITTLIRVLTSPNSTSIEGYTPGSPVREGEVLKLICRSRGGNPPPNLLWLKDGHLLPHEIMTQRARGNRVSESILNLEVKATDHAAEIQCKPSTEIETNHSLEASVRLTVHFGPKKVSITGPSKVQRGKSVVLHCVAAPANPAVNLEWSIDGIPVEADSKTALVTQTENGFISSSNLTLVTSSENQSPIRIVDCHTRSNFSKGSMYGRHRLNITFSPAHVEVTVHPPLARVGSNVSFVCNASWSLPTVTLRWFKGAHEIESDYPQMTQRSEFDGISSVSTITFISVTAANNGELITCSAFNPLLNSTTTDKKYLQVAYPPMFSRSSWNFNLTEGESQVFNISAVANPPVADSDGYSWTRNGATVDNFETPNGGVKNSVSFRGPLLHLVNATRSHAGVYSVKAENNLGRSEASVQINIFYHPVIDNITEIVHVNEGGSAQLRCSAKANPSPPDLLSWRWLGAPSVGLDVQERMKGGSVVVLNIPKVFRNFSGTFECLANNGIGTISKRTAQLVVNYAPSILTAPDAPRHRIAAAVDDTIEISCKSDGIPTVDFQWLFNGRSLLGMQPNFEFSSRSGQKLFSEGVLVIKRVDFSDYGVYSCVASNTLGTSNINFTLVQKSVPDTPTGLEAYNVSHQTVKIRWHSVFDGGYPRTYYIFYQEIDSNRLPSMQVSFDPHIGTGNELPLNGVAENVLMNVSTTRTSFVVEGLAPNTWYLIAVRSVNKLGWSHSTDTIAVATRDAPQTDLTTPLSGSNRNIFSSTLLRSSSNPAIYGIALAGILLCVNLCLFLVIMRRRKRITRLSLGSTGTVDLSLASKKSRRINDTHMMIFGEQSPQGEKSLSKRSPRIINDDLWIQNSSKLEFPPTSFKMEGDLNACPNKFLNDDPDQHRFLRTDATLQSSKHREASILPARHVSYDVSSSNYEDTISLTALDKDTYSLKRYQSSTATTTTTTQCRLQQHNQNPNLRNQSLISSQISLSSSQPHEPFV